MIAEEAYPRDFVRYYFDLLRKVHERYPMPGPLSIEQPDRFVARADGRYAGALLQ